MSLHDDPGADDIPDPEEVLEPHPREDVDDREVPLTEPDEPDPPLDDEDGDV